MDESRYRQRLPCVELTRDGEQMPWVGHPGLGTVTVDDVAAVLDSVDDALEAAYEAANAAVLVPLIERNGTLSVILTRRSSTLEYDAGNISFPGGRRELGEGTLETALRETEEEVGLPESAIRVLGGLELARRAVDQTAVAAYVAIVEGSPTLIPSPDEVELVLEVPLAELFGDGVAWEEVWTRDGVERTMHFFGDSTALGDDLVWGLSARILRDLLVRLWAATRGLDADSGGA